MPIILFLTGPILQCSDSGRGTDQHEGCEIFPDAVDTAIDIAFKNLDASTLKNSPMAVCAVPNRSEIWVACDGQEGASIVIIDMKTSQKKEFSLRTPSNGKGNFHIVGLYALDDQYIAAVLRSKLDSIVTFSVKKRKVSRYFTLDVNNTMISSSLVSSSNFIFLGLRDGTFIRYPKDQFLKGRLRDKTFVEVNKNQSVSSLCVSADLKLFVSNDSYIYEYLSAALDLNRVRPNRRNVGNTRYGESECMVDTIKLSDNSDVLYVFYTNCSILRSFCTKTFEEFEMINCSEVVKKLKPRCESLDQRVTCYCPVNDTIWIGTGSGHILIFEMMMGKKPQFIVSMHPYKWETRSLVAYKNGLASCEAMCNILISTGRELNHNDLGYVNNSVCSLGDDSYVDPSSGPSYSSEKFEGQNTTIKRKNVLLFFKAVPANALKKLVSDATKSDLFIPKALKFLSSVKPLKDTDEDSLLERTVDTLDTESSPLESLSKEVL